jgi:hypothetical protein
VVKNYVTDIMNFKKVAFVGFPFISFSSLMILSAENLEFFTENIHSAATLTPQPRAAASLPTLLVVSLSVNTLIAHYKVTFN